MLNKMLDLVNTKDEAEIYPPYTLVLDKCKQTEWIFNSKTGEKKQCYSCERPDLIMKLSVEEDEVKAYEAPTKIGKTIYEALVSMIINASNNLSRGKSANLSDEEFTFSVTFDNNGIHFMYYLDKQGRVCGEANPDVCMAITLYFIAKINGDWIDLAPLLENTEYFGTINYDYNFPDPDAIFEDDPDDSEQCDE